MTLEKQDAELFYQLWFPLLDFVNQKYQVCPGAGTIDRNRGVDAADAKKVANYLWSHTEVLQEYLAQADLSEELAQIVAGWAQCKPGKYIMERHLKKGTVFISEDDQKVYMVKGWFQAGKKCLEKARCYWMRYCSRSGTVLFRTGWLYPIRSASGEGSATPSKEFTWTQRQTVQFVFHSVTVNRNPNPKRRQSGPKWRAL